MLPDYLNSFPGQLVSWVVDEIRKGGDLAATGWDSQTDDARMERLDTMATRAEEFAQRLVEIVTSEGQQIVKGTIESVTFKQGVKVVVNCAKTTPHVGELAMQSGAVVQLLTPQLVMDLDGGDAAQETLDLGGSAGWTPPDDDEQGPTLCLCIGDSINPTCPIHGENPTHPVAECICAKDGNTITEFNPECPVHDPAIYTNDEPECTCVRLDGVEIDEFDPDCPIHGDDSPDLGADAEPPPTPDTDAELPPAPGSGDDDDLEHKPDNPADADDPESENVG